MTTVTIRCLASLLLALFIVSCGPDDKPDAKDNVTNPDAATAPASTALKSSKEFFSTDEAIDRDTHPGGALFEESCANCHMGGVPKAPHFSWLEMMNPHALLRSMTEGVMAPQAAHLSPEERIQVVEYITRSPFDETEPKRVEPERCDGEAVQFDMDSPPIPVNWGHDTARYISGDDAGLTVADIPSLELKWAYAFPDAQRARSQPAIAMGALFVGSQDGTVYAFDLETGCVHWTFDAAAEVRTGIVLSLPEDEATQVDADNPPIAYFGDILANLYAVNALTGERVWSAKVDDHPSATLTGTPAYHDGKLYIPVSSLEVIPAADPDYECCTFRGKVIAMDAVTGEQIWLYHTIPDEPVERGRTETGTRILSPSGAPVWSSPAVDTRRNVIYFGTGQNYSTPADGNSNAVHAVHMDSGERAWVRQSTPDDAWNVACMMEDNPNCPEEDGPDFDHGASMILTETSGGRDVLAVGHKNGTAFALDPDNQGALLWETRVGRGSIQGGVHFGMAAEGERLYVPMNDMNNTRNGDFLDPDLARPGVNALDVSTGKVLWSHVQTDLCGPDRPYCDPGISAAITAVPGVVFAGHMDGYLRAYDGENGRVLWEYNTARELQTITGETGRGGSMSGPGVAIRDGYVVTNSGYGLYFHEPGNLLLVFGTGQD